MRRAAFLLCFLLAAIIVLPVMAEEIAIPATTLPGTTHETTKATTAPTPEPTKEPTVVPTTVVTKEPTTEATRERTTEPTPEPTREPTRAPTTEPTQVTTTSSGPKVGWITIISTPSGAAVTIDGKHAGVTPLAGTEVASGTSHVVRITMDGYEPYESSVSVSPGEQSALDATLKAKTTPEPTKTPTPEPTITIGPIGGDKGWIRINANVDGATASLGELSSGCTISGGSCTILVATTGTPQKTFTVQKPGYSVYTGQLTSWPREGQTLDVYATLNPTPSTGSIKVSSYPSGAVATLDGGNWQYTTATFSPVTAGTNHNVQISLNGYQTYSTSVYVSAGETAYVDTSLVPANPKPYTGSLRVTTSPSGADIYVDGRYMAASPNLITSLSPGTHSLRMHKAGYDEYLRTFTISAGQLTTVDYTFSPLSPSFGSIEVASTPAGATLFLDGNYMGLTPAGEYFDITSLVPGTHTITIRMTDYQDYTQTVYVGGGKIVTINAQLTPVAPGPVADTTGQVSVTSTPPAADVFLDNVFKGVSPLTLSDIAQGSHTLTVKLDGYTDATQMVTVNGGQTTPVTLALAETAATTVTKTPLSVIPVLLALFLIAAVAYRKNE